MISNLRPPITQTAAASGTAAIGMVSMDSAAAGTRPYAITTAGPVQLSASEWPSPVVSGQSTTNDALFGSDGTNKIVGFLGDALNASGSSSKYRALSEANGAGNWTLGATDTNRTMTENQYTYTTGTFTWCWAHGSVLVRLSMSGTPPTVSAYTYSTDGGANWTTPSNTGLTGSWGSYGVPVRVYSNGAFRVIAEYQGGAPFANGVSKLSIDSGTNWTAYTPGSETAMCYEYDSGADLFVAATMARGFSDLGTTLTIYTKTRTSGGWTSRQTFTLASGGFACVCVMRIVGSYCYLLIRLSSGNWTLHRAAVSSLATSNPFGSVHNPGGTHDANRLSTPMLFSDGNLRYMVAGQIYKSSDGSNGSWSADGSSFSNSAGQLTPIP